MSYFVTKVIPCTTYYPYLPIFFWPAILSKFVVFHNFHKPPSTKPSKAFTLNTRHLINILIFSLMQPRRYTFKDMVSIHLPVTAHLRFARAVRTTAPQILILVKFYVSQTKRILLIKPCLLRVHFLVVIDNVGFLYRHPNLNGTCLYVILFRNMLFVDFTVYVPLVTICFVLKLLLFAFLVIGIVSLGEIFSLMLNVVFGW